MKKIIYKLMVLIVIFVIFAFSNISLASTENHWASETINEFVNKEYLSGEILEKSYDEEITKGEFASIINHYFGYGTAYSEKEHLKLAEAKGYLLNAKVEENISREEVAIVMCNILSLTTVQSLPDSFLDDEQISVWAKGYVYSLVKEKIVIGYPDYTYNPQKNITRAEFVTILNRCTGVGGNELILEDKDVDDIEVCIANYEDGVISMTPVDASLKLKSGDEINFGVALPEECEGEFTVEIKDESIVFFEKDIEHLTAKKIGETEIIFEADKYEKIIKVIVE